MADTASVSLRCLAISCCLLAGFACDLYLPPALWPGNLSFDIGPMSGQAVTWIAHWWPGRAGLILYIPNQTIAPYRAVGIKR
jgi:hypothetical protein